MTNNNYTEKQVKILVICTILISFVITSLFFIELGKEFIQYKISIEDKLAYKDFSSCYDNGIMTDNCKPKLLYDNNYSNLSNFTALYPNLF